MSAKNGRPAWLTRLYHPLTVVIFILRGREKIVPHGNTVLQSGDVLTAVGPTEAWEEMRSLTHGL